MPSPTRSKEPMHSKVLRLVLSGLMGALLVVSKQAMSGLPNIEPLVSTLTIIGPLTRRGVFCRVCSVFSRLTNGDREENDCNCEVA